MSFYCKSPNFLRPWAKFNKQHFRRQILDLGSLKQFGTTCRVPNFLSLKITPPYWGWVLNIGSFPRNMEQILLVLILLQDMFWYKCRMYSYIVQSWISAAIFPRHTFYLFFCYLSLFFHMFFFYLPFFIFVFCAVISQINLTRISKYVLQMVSHLQSWVCKHFLKDL